MLIRTLAVIYAVLASTGYGLTLEEEDQLIVDVMGVEALYDPIPEPATEQQPIVAVEDAKGKVPNCRCPTIKPRCKPSSDEGDCHCSTTFDPSSYIDCCCQYTFISEWDFYYRYPQLDGPTQNWHYYTNGDFVADGGYITFTRKGGLLNTSRYNVTVAKSSIPYLDNYKYLVFANEPVELDSDQENVFEYWMQARTFFTDASPYPKNILKCPDDDVRLAAASVNVYDPATELYFNFLVTNDMVYAVYGRNADKRDPQDYNYAAFNFVIPLLWRKPTDTHKLKVILGRRQRTVRWKIDNKEYFRVEDVGARIDRQYMTADFGGADDEVFPESVLYGFGSMTLLNHYPACWRACDNKPCIYAASRQALYKTGDAQAPEQYDPIQGKPVPAVFWNTMNTEERFRVWGQGSATFFKRISVYLQNCKQTNINRYKTITVTTTVTATPTNRI